MLQANSASRRPSKQEPQAMPAAKRRGVKARRMQKVDQLGALVLATAAIVWALPKRQQHMGRMLSPLPLLLLQLLLCMLRVRAQRTAAVMSVEVTVVCRTQTDRREQVVPQQGQLLAMVVSAESRGHPQQPQHLHLAPHMQLWWERPWQQNKTGFLLSRWGAPEIACFLLILHACFDACTHTTPLLHSQRIS
ncbi:hypothetical protein DUNSADRAFT_13814 [Dunaliella salina]|uniref:Encoded protein n=1 Tax=Dunaliella salina TaxID=3046 RepID=A0ABQ7G8L5_DUNSA|nr:hypothetical protein DUNSADRAFT_13814 [Dunaliella salina]|eukprot:KAF5830957.1 hypothetical protein DUNSADRAFT_13814 [Dunaliella salina]